MNDSFALVWYRFDIEILGLHVWVLKVTSDDMTFCWFDIACWDSAGCVWVIFCALNYCMFSETSHCFDRFYRCETINIWKRTIVDPSWDGVKPQGHVTYTTGKADPRTRSNSIALAMELRLSCTNPSTCNTSWEVCPLCVFCCVSWWVTHIYIYIIVPISCRVPALMLGKL